VAVIWASIFSQIDPTQFLNDFDSMFCCELVDFGLTASWFFQAVFFSILLCRGFLLWESNTGFVALMSLLLF